MPARVLKEYDERKNELLDAAQRLFIEQGYESTSVNAIIDSVGVAKGTFYHYFKSKSDLLDSLVERITERILSQVRNALEVREMDAIAKLNVVFQASSRWKADNREALLALLRPIYSDENVLLRLKMTKRSIETTAPLLAEIIAQGVREGVFDSQHPEETADMVMSLSVVFRETHAQRFLESWKDPEAWANLGCWPWRRFRWAWWRATAWSPGWSRRSARRCSGSRRWFCRKPTPRRPSRF